MGDNEQVCADGRGRLLTASSKQVCIEEDNGYRLLSANRKAPAEKQTSIDKENGRGSFLTAIHKQVCIEEENDDRYCLLIAGREALAGKQTSINKENDRGSLVRHGL